MSLKVEQSVFPVSRVAAGITVRWICSCSRNQWGGLLGAILSILYEKTARVQHQFAVQGAPFRVRRHPAAGARGRGGFLVRREESTH
jgi:hypothetical protein